MQVWIKHGNSQYAWMDAKITAAFDGGYYNVVERGPHSDHKMLSSQWIGDLHRDQQESRTLSYVPASFIRRAFRLEEAVQMRLAPSAPWKDALVVKVLADGLYDLRLDNGVSEESIPSFNMRR